MWRDQYGRPFTDGCVDGPSAVFGGHSVSVDWLVDSGAGIAAIRDSVGANFSWKVKVGVTAGPQGAWSVTEDLEISFDDDNGQCRMPTQTRIALKPDDADADLISARELAHFGLSLAVGSGAQSPSLR